MENKDLSYMLINYDANGNTVQRDYFRNKDEIYEQELYEYNYDNMMVHYIRHRPEIKDNRINMIIESELNMEYDVNGMRVIKKSYPNTSDSTIYIYEGGEVVLEMSYNQIPENKHLFTYAGGKKVSRTSFNQDGTIDLNSRKFFHQNFLGSIAMITDKDGNIEEHNKYEPFGDIIWSKSYTDTDNNYKFTGKERDKESNLDYFNARYLDTKLGRFMKADVVTGNIKSPQTLNRWVYCNNNPIKYVDPTGMYSQPTRNTGGPPEGIIQLTSYKGNSGHTFVITSYYSSPGMMDIKVYDFDMQVFFREESLERELKNQYLYSIEYLKQLGFKKEAEELENLYKDNRVFFHISKEYNKRVEIRKRYLSIFGPKELHVYKGFLYCMPNSKINTSYKFRSRVSANLLLHELDHSHGVYSEKITWYDEWARTTQLRIGKDLPDDTVLSNIIFSSEFSYVADLYAGLFYTSRDERKAFWDPDDPYYGPELKPSTFPFPENWYEEE